MVQNLKVDIIYHSTASDFEMEFNLCGCCRMRLLSDKTTDRKGFVKALARDVSRSRIIIACGPLFGDDGLINTVALAIGSGVALCDNKTYGINSDESIHIISGSTPLVTPDGYFGGCIIESGPQTIILLTENKTFRKSIMQNLIHPYIEEISYLPTKAVPVAPTDKDPSPEFETAVSEEENYLTSPDEEYGDDDFKENVYETATTSEDQHNIEFVMDGDSDTPESEPLPSGNSPDNSDRTFDNMYTEIETPDDIKSRYQNPYTPSEGDQMFIASVERDEEEKPTKGKNRLRTMDITIVVLVLLLLLAILALVYFVVLRPITMGISTGDYLKEIFGLASSTTKV